MLCFISLHLEFASGCRITHTAVHNTLASLQSNRAKFMVASFAFVSVLNSVIFVKYEVYSSMLILS